MKTTWKWLRCGAVAAFVILLGLAGAGGRVFVDRRDMYGEDPANDPYSPDFDPFRQPRR
jgi:hypothetical protein